jgi:hypothetical protein
MRTTRTTTTKSELETTVAELETQLESLVSAADATATQSTGKALGRLRWRITEVLELSSEARTTILAEIDTMIDNL